MVTQKSSYLTEKAKDIRRETIKCIGNLGVGHIGGCLSVAEVLSVLYFDAMKIDPQNPKMPDRDRLIVSKGHAGPAVYAALALRGYFGVEELMTLNKNGTSLPSHCDMNKTTGIDMTTGSLGQGFSIATGMALGAKMDNLGITIYTIIGDGESQEGQIWEAAMFAGNRKLDNLVAFTDNNKIQLDGWTGEINSLHPLEDKWKAFGWHVQHVDGHNAHEISRAITCAKSAFGFPSMIILDTVKGRGAYFSDNNPDSHSMTVTEEMWRKAVAEL
ncbi:MAG: transketolase [Defluviitaleaceae bacterium]|nr:transketolase [Defluviitaleaceae bacterium]MCL2835542.1 transketolase [Defluviitaleaceae bacterium]